jgi:putative peptidoglycan lipid II flippase
MILAEPILMTLFQYGKLTSRDVAMATLSLQAYSVGLLAFMLIKVLAPGYFSRLDTKTPVRIGIQAMLANMIFNIVLVVPLHFYWQIGHVGLALATSISAILNAGLLYRGLQRQGVYSPMPGFVAVCLRLVLAAAVMSVVLLLLVAEPAQWAQWLWWQRSGQLLLLCAAGAASYFVSLLLLGAKPRHFRADASISA